MNWKRATVAAGSAPDDRAAGVRPDARPKATDSPCRKPAPDFVLTVFAPGRSRRSWSAIPHAWRPSRRDCGQFQGRCQSAAMNMPTSRMAMAYYDRGVRFRGGSQRSGSFGRRWIEEMVAGVPVTIDQERALQSYGLYGVPRPFVTGRARCHTYRTSANDLSQKLDSLLSARTPRGIVWHFASARGACGGRFDFFGAGRRRGLTRLSRQRRRTQVSHDDASGIRACCSAARTYSGFARLAQQMRDPIRDQPRAGRPR
jgi:hypothetical protein